MGCDGLSWAWGGMGELAVVNDYNLAVVPNGVSDIQAVMIEPAAVAVYAADRGGVQTIKDMTEEAVGVDVAMECVGLEASLNTCVNAVRNQGKVVKQGFDALLDKSVNHMKILVTV